ncbi:hypothetical protein DdX_07094 [Ditylenchus destructor]|uniref:Uncharacterized protein n=1 Tax=Ditylenchus destructor TaxID=166010 RepID=A0AAD4N553_9BILA|nr:hypothetical protein DdX_07094 [Ditylenchus destructor]
MYNMIIGRDWIAKLPPISIDYCEGEYRIGRKRLEWMLSPRMRPTILMLKQTEEGKNPTQMCHNFDTPESYSIMNEYRTWKSDCYFDFMNRSLELEELFNELSAAFERDSENSLYIIEICARSSNHEKKLLEFLRKLQKISVGDRHINIKLTFYEELDIRCDIFNGTDGSYSTSETIRIAQQARCALIQYEDTISKLKIFLLPSIKSQTSASKPSQKSFEAIGPTCTIPEIPAEEQEALKDDGAEELTNVTGYNNKNVHKKITAEPESPPSHRYFLRSRSK